VVAEVSHRGAGMWESRTASARLAPETRRCGGGTGSPATEIEGGEMRKISRSPKRETGSSPQTVLHKAFGQNGTEPDIPVPVDQTPLIGPCGPGSVVVHDRNVEFRRHPYSLRQHPVILTETLLFRAQSGVPCLSGAYLTAVPVPDEYVLIRSYKRRPFGAGNGLHGGAAFARGICCEVTFSVSF
jgi:hypothetical protein